jgi:hypothetical protein
MCAWPSKALDLVVEVEVVEDQVLREAQLVHRADRQRVVDHVRRRVAVGRHVDVHAEPVLGVRPRADVLGHDVDPLAVPLRERVRRPSALAMLCWTWRTTFALLR